MDQVSSAASPVSPSPTTNLPTQESSASPTAASSNEPSGGGDQQTSASPTPSAEASSEPQQTPAPTPTAQPPSSSPNVTPTSNGQSPSNSHANPTATGSGHPAPATNGGASSPTQPSSIGGSSSQVNSGAVAGGVVGGVVGAALLALVLFLIWRRRRRQRLGQAPQKLEDDSMSQYYRYDVDDGGDDRHWRQGGVTAGGWSQQEGRIGPTVQHNSLQYYNVNKPNVPIYKPDEPLSARTSHRRPYPPADGDAASASPPTTPISLQEPSTTSVAAAGPAAVQHGADAFDKPDEMDQGRIQ